MQVRDPSSPCGPHRCPGVLSLCQALSERGYSKILKLHLGLWQLCFSPAQVDLPEGSKWVTPGRSPRAPKPQKGV